MLTQGGNYKNVLTQYTNGLILSYCYLDFRNKFNFLGHIRYAIRKYNSFHASSRNMVWNWRFYPSTQKRQLMNFGVLSSENAQANRCCYEGEIDLLIYFLSSTNKVASKPRISLIAPSKFYLHVKTTYLVVVCYTNIIEKPLWLPSGSNPEGRRNVIQTLLLKICFFSYMRGRPCYYIHSTTPGPTHVKADF